MVAFSRHHSWLVDRANLARLREQCSGIFLRRFAPRTRDRSHLYPNAARSIQCQHPEHFETLILGSGQGGKLLAWHLARSGRRTAVAERQWIGGSCPHVACMPSKNEVWSARVIHLVKHAAQFGAMTGPVDNMAKVRQRKRNMVEREIALHLQNYKTSGAELIMGSGHFVAAKTLEVRLNDGGTHLLTGDQVFLNIGTHAAIRISSVWRRPDRSTYRSSRSGYAPSHLIVLGGGYVGLEMAQVYRRFGSRVTVIEAGPQLIGREDPDIADALQRDPRR